MTAARQVEMLLGGLRDTNAQPLSGGWVYSYEGGTSTEKPLYTDVQLTNPASNPLELDSNGRAVVFARGNYNLVVKDADDVLVFSADNIFFGDTSASNYAGTATGTTDAITASLTPPLVVLTAGQTVTFVASATNTTTTPTLNVNGLGAKTIVKTNGTALGIGDIASAALVEVLYDGTNWRVITVTAITAASLAGLLDGTSVTLDGSDLISVKDAGVTAAKLGANAVTDAKIRLTTYLKFRNAADTADINVIAHDVNDTTYLRSGEVGGVVIAPHGANALICVEDTLYSSSPGAVSLGWTGSYFKNLFVSRGVARPYAEVTALANNASEGTRPTLSLGAVTIVTAAADKGVLLPVGVAGDEILLWVNNSTHMVTLYSAGGTQVMNGSASWALQPATAYHLYCYAANNWMIK